jgi:hypothetical protein
MEKIVSELRIKRTKSSKVPPGAYRVFDPGELVLVYRERLDEWKGPYPITRIEGKTIHFRDGDTEKPFSITAVKSYVSPEHFGKDFIAHIARILHTAKTTPIMSCRFPENILVWVTEV